MRISDWSSDVCSSDLLKEGEALIVAVSVTTDRAMPDALLTDLLTAGMEVENFNLGDGKQSADVVVDGIEITDRARDADVRDEEYRDDRYVAALKVGAGERKRDGRGKKVSGRVEYGEGRDM